MRVSMLRYRNFFLCRKTSQKKATGVHFFCIRYPYDALNRITGAASTGNSFTGRYDLSNVTYDKNGNILALTRGGHLDTNATSFGVMDDLRYFYDAGNKLTSVDDKAQNTQGFKDGNTSGDDYSYDVNGNMISDKNKGITNITYNHLNLPKTVSINANDYITYVYDAAGVKQAKYVIRNGGIGPGNITATKYAGNYIYENNVLQFFSTSEGYVKYNQSSQKFEYVYQMKDHLGNVRLSYTDTDASGDISQDEIIQENHYMPFGLKMRGFNNVVNSNGNSVAEKRMFGGKEYNEELGLNWYDITARNYDPALGRWMNVDPLAETMPSHSPYNYAFNNPIIYIDPTGMAPEMPDDLIVKGDVAAFKKRVSQSTGGFYDAKVDSKGNVTLEKTGLEKEMGGMIEMSDKRLGRPIIEPHLIGNTGLAYRVSQGQFKTVLELGNEKE